MTDGTRDPRDKDGGLVAVEPSTTDLRNAEPVADAARQEGQEGRGEVDETDPSQILDRDFEREPLAHPPQSPAELVREPVGESGLVTGSYDRMTEPGPSEAPNSERQASDF